MTHALVINYNGCQETHLHIKELMRSQQVQKMFTTMYCAHLKSGPVIVY